MRSHQSAPVSSKVVERMKRRGRPRSPEESCFDGKMDAVSATSSVSEEEQNSTASASISRKSHGAGSSAQSREDHTTTEYRGQRGVLQSGRPSLESESLVNRNADFTPDGLPCSQVDHNAFFPSESRNPLMGMVAIDRRRRALNLNDNLETTSHFLSRGYMPLTNRLSVLQPTADVIRSEHQELIDTLGSASGGILNLDTRSRLLNPDYRMSGGVGTPLDLYSHTDTLESARQRHLLRVHEANRAFQAFHHLSSVFSPSYVGVTAALRPTAEGMHAMFPDLASRSPRTLTSQGHFLTSSTRSILPVDRTSSGGIGPLVRLPHLLHRGEQVGSMNQSVEDEKAFFPILTCSMSDNAFAQLDQSGRLRRQDDDSAASRKLQGPPAKKAMKRKPGSRDRRFNSSTPISLVAAARSDNTEVLELTGRPPLSLYVEKDTEHLSDYQCYLRQQIEIFEATPEDLQYNAQKMNKAVVLGQVGIRCKHCAHEDPWARTRGAVYYSASLGGLYQAGQNMSKNHLENECTAIPSHIREELLKKKFIKRRAAGGKKFWADSARSLGIFEDQYGLRFSKMKQDNEGKKAKLDDKTTDHADEMSSPG